MKLLDLIDGRVRENSPNRLVGRAKENFTSNGETKWPKGGSYREKKTGRPGDVGRMNF